MDLKKIKEDFEKRYGMAPENMFFCGKPIIFIKRPGLSLGASLSAGGYIATMPRDDGRIQIQYSDSNRLFCTNIEELAIHRGERICDLLFGLMARGATIGGADILVYENTNLSMPPEALLLCAHGSFCKNALPPAEAIKHFENYEENFICMSSKGNHITVMGGKEPEYLPFHNQKFKIVLCSTPEKVSVKEYSQGGAADDARAALLSQDVEKFGHIINKSTVILLKKCHAKLSQRLFEAAAELGDSLGNGILPWGGIFSLVENDRVDTFIHNLGSVYEKHYGGRPEFYITKAEDSGIRLPLPEN